MEKRCHRLSKRVKQWSGLKSVFLLLTLVPALTFSAQDGDYLVQDESEEIYFEEIEDYGYLDENGEWQYGEEPLSPRREKEVHEDVENYKQSSLTIEEITEEDWNEIKGDKSYTEGDLEKQEEEEEEEDMDFSMPGMAEAWRWFLILVIASVFIYLIIRLTQERSASNLKVEDLDVATLDNAEQHLHESDLEGLLQRAIDSNDYRSALRLRYLIALRELDAKGWIEHLPAKTSMSYIIEMDGRVQQSTFRELSRIFDYVWYAEVDVPAEDDRMFARRFSDFMQTIND